LGVRGDWIDSRGRERRTSSRRRMCGKKASK
jgi:hypothetical protein